jgi:hypothetical protein
MNVATEIELIEDISEENAPAIYVTGGLQRFFDAVHGEVATEVPDLTTKKGRDRVASLAAKVSKSKAAVEKPGRDYLRRLKDMPKTVEAELRDFVDKMDALRDATRKPLTDWEAAEADRVFKLETRLGSLAFASTEGMSAAEIGARIQDLDSMEVGADWEEFENEAHRVKASTLEAMRAALAAREKYESEQAELADLRRKQAEQEQKDREAQIAREATERAQREAEQKAQAERDAAAKREADAKAASDRRELELKLEAEASQRRELEAKQRAEQAERDAEAKAERAAQVERQRQADEQAEQARQAAAREADVANKTAVLKAAKEAVMKAGVTEDQARAVINLIRQGLVPNVSIAF